VLRRILDSPAFYFVCAAILLVVAVASQFELSVPTRPVGSVQDIENLPALPDGEEGLNVVLILIDTLRADRLGLYGYERDTSPTIDDLGRYGVVFRNVVSQSSWTKTSMASLWTGTYPVRHGVLRYNHVLPEDVKLPAEIFDEAGYRTAGIWRNGWVAPNFGFGQGFDVYVKPTIGRERANIKHSNPSSNRLQGTDVDLLRSATEFLGNFGHEKFFLYVHMMDLHQYVYDEKATDFGPSYSDAYDKSINWTDRLVAALVQELDDRDLLKKTLVVIASDHGEAFQEHGSEGHARDLHREVTQVPLVLALPFRLDPGIQVEQRISNVDIWPTLLDLAGLPPMPGVDGVSRVPLILEAGGESVQAAADGPSFSQLDRRWGHPRFEPRPLVAVTEDHLRLLVDTGDTDAVELYDLDADPKEQENLAKARPEDAARLKGEIDHYLENAEPPWGAAPGVVELDEMKLNQLRALGYKIEGE